MPMHCVVEDFVLEELLNRINLGQFRPVPAWEPICKTHFHKAWKVLRVTSRDTSLVSNWHPLDICSLHTFPLR